MSEAPAKCDWCDGSGITSGYGFFPGGDPRDFSPDTESCTDEEINAHAEECGRWERGERADEGHSGRIADVETKHGRGVALVCGHRFGIGTYTMKCECAGETR